MKFFLFLVYTCIAILLSKYAFTQETGVIFQNVFEEDIFLGNSIQVIFQDRRGYVWLSGGSDVYRYDGNKFFTLHPFQDTSMSNLPGFIHTINEDNKGNIWFVNNSGLAKYIPKTDELVSFQLSNSKNRHIFKNCYIQNDSTFWLGANNGVFLFNPILVNLNLDHVSDYAQDIKISITEPVNYINSCKKWIIASTENNLIFIDKKQRKLEKKVDLDTLLKKDISCKECLVSKDGRLFIGTKKGGIYSLQIDTPQSISYKALFSSTNKTFTDTVFKFCENVSGDLIIRTMKKLFVLGGGKIDNPVLASYDFYSGNNNKFTESKVLSILCDRNGSLWTGADEKISRANLPRAGVMFNPKKGERDFCYQVKSIYYRNKKIYIDENQRLFVYDKMNDKYKSIIPDNFDALSETGVLKVFDVAQDNDSLLWLGTNSGLWSLKHNGIDEDGFSSFHWEKHKSGSADKKEKYGNIIHAVHFQEMKNGGFIFLASNKGAFKLNLMSGDIHNYHAHSNNPPSHIGVCQDKIGRLWTTTRHNLYEIRGDELLDYTPFIKSYNEKFKFLKHTFKSESDSIVFFCTDIGTLELQPEKIGPRTAIPEVIISSLYISGQKVGVYDTISGRIILRKDISFCDEIILTAQHNSFKFEFTLPVYYGNSLKKYKYKLTGIDDSWSTTVNSNPYANYSNIPPGNYVLQVHGCNSDGIWGKTPKELHVIVLPPWYKTTWFKIIVVVFLVSTLFSLMYIRYQELKNRQVILESLVLKRTSEIEERNKLLEKQAENLNLMNNILEKKQEKILEQAAELRRSNSTKDKFFSIIAHDLRNPFNLIIGFSELLRMKFSENLPERANKYVNTIFQTAQKGSSLLENLLEWSRSQTGNLEFFPQIFSLEKIADDCLSHFNSMALQKDISMANKIDPLHYTYADENMIRTIFRNLLSNALKFTPEKGEIILKSISEEKNLVVCIEDNGVGIKSRDLKKLFQMDHPYTTEGTNNEEGTGLGLMLVKEFVNRNNGKIWVESEYQVGSKFYFTLPLSNAYPNKN